MPTPPKKKPATTSKPAKPAAKPSAKPKVKPKPGADIQPT